MPKPKTGGIQKGYVYPKTLEFKKALDENGFFIVEELIKLYHDADKPFLKLAILQEMNKYAYAIPRDNGPANPENPNPDGDDPITINDILTMIDVTPGKDEK